MSYRSGVESLLTDMAEQLDMVVDPSLRMRLQSHYLTLLKAYHAGDRSRSHVQAVRSLASQVQNGATQYRLNPGLGIINEKFYAARDSAFRVISRLKALAGAQNDLAVRRRWLGEIADFEGQLSQLVTYSQMMVTTKHISRLDSLAATASNIVAVHLVPRLVRWSAELGRKVPNIEASGASAAASMAARPDLFTGTGLGEDAWDWFKRIGEGVFSAGKDAALAAAEKKYQEYAAMVSRVAATRKAQTEQEARLQSLQAGKTQPAQAVIDRVGENRRMLDSNIAAVKSLARNISSTLVVPWDDPERMAASQLGMTDEQGASILLYAGEIDAINNATAQLESTQAAVWQEIGSPSLTAMGGGKMLIAALAVAGGMYMLGRKK